MAEFKVGDLIKLRMISESCRIGIIAGVNGAGYHILIRGRFVKGILLWWAKIDSGRVTKLKGFEGREKQLKQIFRLEALLDPNYAIREMGRAL